jgi:hypothetical protein
VEPLGGDIAAIRQGHGERHLDQVIVDYRVQPREHEACDQSNQHAAEHLADEDGERLGHARIMAECERAECRVQRDGHPIVDQAFAFGDRGQSRWSAQASEDANHGDRVGSSHDAAKQEANRQRQSDNECDQRAHDQGSHQRAWQREECDWPPGRPRFAEVESKRGIEQERR